MTHLPRPHLHFTPPSGWMNDPNGLVYHDGVYHLFYQYHPESLVWGPMHWGHATSRDLLTWEHHPIALAPDDQGTIFSGSAVWDGGNTSGLVPGGGFVAMYSYSKQTQGIAFSQDQGLTWTKYAGNPVLPALAPDFRDPKVFAHGGGWSMVLAAGKQVEFYSSPDLLHWTRTGQFTAELDAGVWECPDVFPLTSQGRTFWVLLVSVTEGAPNGGSGTLFWHGDFDGTTYQPRSQPAWLDQGTDDYAGVTWNHAPDGRRVFLGWMNNWRYAREIPAKTWRGAMTLPRVLSLSDDPVPALLQGPIGELALRRQGATTFSAANRRGDVELAHLTHPGDAELVLTSTAGRPVTLVWTSGSTCTSLTWDPEGSMVLDRSQAQDSSFHEHFRVPTRLSLSGPGERLGLRIVTDVHSIEVFAEAGRSVLTALVYWAEGDSTLVARAEGEQWSVQGTVWALTVSPSPLSSPAD